MRDKIILAKTFFALLGVYVALLGVAFFLNYHPIWNSVYFIEDMVKCVTRVLPHRIFVLLGLSIGGIVLLNAISIRRSMLSRGVSNGK